MKINLRTTPSVAVHHPRSSSSRPPFGRPPAAFTYGAPKGGALYWGLSRPQPPDQRPLNMYT